MAETTRRFSPLITVLLGLALTTPAVAATAYFGDIEITLVSEPKGDSSHGYLEYLFHVINKSGDQPHTVELSIPFDRYTGRDDSIRALRRTVRVGANETVHVSLLQPDYPPIDGTGTAVTIDGQHQETPIQMKPNETNFMLSYLSHFGTSAGVFGPAEPLVLIGQRGKTLADLGAILPAGIPELPLPGELEVPGGELGKAESKGPLRPGPPPKSPSPRQFPGGPRSQSQVRATVWSGDWLSYSRYDGITITADEFNALPAEARSALWRYVETGGVLLVAGPADLRGLSAVTKTTRDSARWTMVHAGFGQCFVSPDAQADRWDAAHYRALLKAMQDAASAWRGQRGTAHANQVFPIVDDLGIPIKGLFVLMFLFVLGIGPINFLVLSRLKRRIWLLWTTPLISLCTCLAVFGYVVLSEGWQGQVRSETLTLLDETTHRATTIGWIGVYVPLTPSDGLHFSHETEVIPQRFHEGRRGEARSCLIDWSNDQHFAAGWVEARVPAHFKVRKSETRPEGVPLREANGRWSMVNGLGAPIRRFWFADDKGAIHVAENVAAGARAVLKLTDKESLPGTNMISLGGDWVSSIQLLTAGPQRYVKPNTYLAELEEAPFVEDPLRGVHKHKAHALVLGFRERAPKGD
jgi:hypothetical protein